MSTAPPPDDGGLPPFTVLHEAARGTELPLPEELARLYGPLCLLSRAARPLLLANFVSSLDGVVALDEPGHTTGGEISGQSTHDRALMGLLRAISDVVVVGARTLAQTPRHSWIPRRIYPPLAPAYRALRAALGMADEPTTAFVTASGALDLRLPPFTSGEARIVVLTTSAGERRLRDQPAPPSTGIVVAGAGERLSAVELLAALESVLPAQRILVEGGPRLFGQFLAERLMDDIFLTLAPQIVGRAEPSERLGLVSGQRFAPEQPLWSTLVSVRQAGSHLFLRYGL